MIRGAAKVKKVGHAGTLDPLASGLLIICTGKMTKQIEQFQGLEKEYTGVITLGATTPSYDLETVPENPQPFEHLTHEQLASAAAQFRGRIEQVPPVFSAVKVNGRRAYKSARKNQEVVLKSREVIITTFALTAVKLPEISFRVVCSKGTYIRSLAHDFGQALGTGGYLSALRRERIGQFSVSDARSPQQWADSIREELAEKP